MGCRKRRSRRSSQGEPPLTRLPHKLFCSFRLHSKVVELGYKIISQATCLSSLAVQLANWRGDFQFGRLFRTQQSKKSEWFEGSLLLILLFSLHHFYYFFNDSPVPVHKLYTKGGVDWQFMESIRRAPTLVCRNILRSGNGLIYLVFNPRVYHCFFRAHIYFNVLVLRLIPAKVSGCVPQLLACRAAWFREHQISSPVPGWLQLS